MATKQLKWHLTIPYSVFRIPYSAFQLLSERFNFSMVCRHFGVVGL